MRCQLCVWLLVGAAASSMVYGDQVFLTNGDRITGKIIKLTDGKMVLASELAGQITIEAKNIKTFGSDAPMKVVLKDGTAFERKTVAGEPNQFIIEASETLKPQSFMVSDIVAINPPVKPEPKWTGNISAGLTSTRGNTRIDAANASINLGKRTEKDRIQVSLDYAKGRQEDTVTGIARTTEDWWRMKGKYDYFFSKKMFGYVDTRYERDGIALLERRMVVGGGAGYQWFETPTTKFSIQGGLASLYEKFDNMPTSNSELSAQAGYNLERQMTKTIKFIHDLTVYPSFNDFADYYLTTTGELRVRFTDRMFLNFKTIFGFDATPAPGRGKTDIKYLLGVGLEF